MPIKNDKAFETSQLQVKVWTVFLCDTQATSNLGL